MPAGGTRQGKKGELCKVKNNMGTRKKERRKWTISEVRLEVEGHCVNVCSNYAMKYVVLWQPLVLGGSVPYHKQNISKKGISP